MQITRNREFSNELEDVFSSIVNFPVRVQLREQIDGKAKESFKCNKLRFKFSVKGEMHKLTNLESIVTT